MSSETPSRIAVMIASLAVTAALIHRIHALGPPYLSRPYTIADHFGASPDDARDALLLMQQAQHVIPHGAEVTCFRPKNGGQWDDTASFLTAVGMLPDHVVLPPFTAANEIPLTEKIEYVIAVKDQFTQSDYAPFAGFPQGYVYRLKR